MTKTNIVSITVHGERTARITLKNGKTLTLTPDDVEMIQLAFATECESCGYNPQNSECYQ